MSLALSLATGYLLFEGIRLLPSGSTRSRGRSAVLAAGSAMVLWQPWAALMVGVGVAAAVRRSKARRRAARSEAAADVAFLGELVGLAVGSGMTFGASLELAAAEVHADLAAEIERVVRVGRSRGLTAALGQAEGHASALFRLCANAMATGAPIGPAIMAHVEETRRTSRSARLAAGRRLPVKLLFPLAFLILPGFTILTLGPALIAAIARISSVS